MAYAMASIPGSILDDTTGKIPCLITPAVTGLGADQHTTYWSLQAGGSSSSNIGGGTTATGGNNGWTGGTAHYPGSAPYAVWVMEGGTVLRDILLLQANVMIGTMQQNFRNYAIPPGSGTTRYGVLIAQSSETRLGAWAIRALGFGAFAAGNGSPEETYLRNLISNNCASWSDYVAWRGGNFGNLGLVYNNDGNGLPPTGSTLGHNFQSQFPQSYFGVAVPMCALLHGDYVAGLSGLVSYIAKWLVNLYTTSFPPFFATVYSIAPSLSDDGAAAPGSYPSTLSQMGIGGGGNTLFATNGTTGVITMTGDAPPPWTLAIGDTWRPQNYAYEGDLNAAPAPFVDGNNYLITATGAGGTYGTFTTATIGASAVSGIGGYWLPTAQGSPGGTIQGATDPDGYCIWQMAGLAMHAIYGTTSADTAWTNCNTRWGGNAATVATRADWAYQKTL
jgi:hypothetical protein